MICKQYFKYWKRYSEEKNRRKTKIRNSLVRNILNLKVRYFKKWSKKAKLNKYIKLTMGSKKRNIIKKYFSSWKKYVKQIGYWRKIIVFYALLVDK